MTRRTVLGFELRNTEKVLAEELAERVGRALGIALTKGEYQQFSAYVGSAFGMTIAMFPWGGPGNTMLHVLEGSVQDAAFVMFPNDTVERAKRLDISDAVADLLSVRGGGSWHRPTLEERRAHTRYSREHEA